MTQTLKDFFSQKDEIDTVILYGSFAKKTYNAHSDIDIAVHSKNVLDFSDLVSMQAELSLLCKREIDIADISKAEGLFLYQIMTTGKKIKLENSVFEFYLRKALCFREDFLPVIQTFQQKKINDFING